MIIGIRSKFFQPILCTMLIIGTGKPLLVPLTTSLYVPGSLADAENIMVDVGTGFYVEKAWHRAVQA